MTHDEHHTEELGMEPPEIPESAFKREVLRPDANLGEVIDAVLKRPVAVGARIRDGQQGQLTWHLFIICLVAIAVYGAVVASFSGHEQWQWAPAKCVGGLFITMIICLPSMHVFACLSGADLPFSASIALMLKAVSLAAMLLTGFAPIAWVFSQSTNSVFVMGVFHLSFWGIAMIFGMRLLLKSVTLFEGGKRGFMRCWIVIFLVTSLQMMTALRPLIGRSDTVLPTEKMFFLDHWGQCANVDTQER
jgi:hypothetical protein